MKGHGGLEGMSSMVFGTLELSTSSLVHDSNKHCEISYSRKTTLSYDIATQPSSLRSWKPSRPPISFATQSPLGYGVYTDLQTSSPMLNVGDMLFVVHLLCFMYVTCLI